MNRIKHTKDFKDKLLSYEIDGKNASAAAITTNLSDIDWLRRQFDSVKYKGVVHLNVEQNNSWRDF